MTTVVTRAAKGSRLTWGEVDANFTNLNENKVETINPTSSGTLTHSGDIVLSGSGKRITGDFSNAAVANRLMFQTSVVNSNTVLGVIPSGTGSAGVLQLYANSDPTNTSLFQAGASASSGQVALISGISGVGTYLPMTFFTGGSERMRIATDGSATFNGLTNFVSDINLSTGTDQYFYFDGALHISKNGTGERLQIDANGNVLVTNATGGLGYGVGAGGTVTQATSKGTAVTLNKPCGRIVTASDALGSLLTATFVVNNNLMASTDIVQLNVTNGNYSARVFNHSAGSFTVALKNESGISLSDAVVINFAIIKGSTT